MSYASILAILTGGLDDAVTLSAGAKFVRGRGGEVRAVLALPTVSSLTYSDGLTGGYISQEVVDLIQEDNDNARRRTDVLIGEISRRAELTSDGASGRIVFLPEQPTLEFDVLGETPLCDLVMVSQSTFKSLGLWSGLVSGALMQARLPFYIVRRVAPEHGVAVIAWDGSQGAGRAVRGALPLLTAASKVVLVQDPDHVSVTHRLAADLNSLGAYLKLHGVRDIHTVSQAGLSRGGGFGAAARQARADVLIAGAFGHARAMEALFGGATDDLLEPAGNFNLLLAH
jgi:nucleotide-binding universal stress UspA family protein